jgi:hypothetical protein
LQTLHQSGFVQFHPALAERLGFKAALFFGHALYWSRHLAKTQPHRSGWFWMTASQWEDATGLTAREQVSVRELLASNRLLTERKAGRPARLHYRVHLDGLASWAGLHLGADAGGAGKITWTSFAPWLKESISFYRPLAAVSGSVASGLYLSYLLRRQYAAVRTGDDGYFRLSRDDARIALCLGSKTQRNARDRLRALGFLYERAGGMCRIDLEALQSALGGTVVMPPRLQLVASAAAPDQASSAFEAAPLFSQSVDAAPAGRQQRLFDNLLTGTPEGQNATLSVMQLFARSAAASVVRADDLAELMQGVSAPPEAAECQLFAVLSKQEPPEVAENAEQGCRFVETGCQLSAVLSKQGCRFVETSVPFCRIHIQEVSSTTTTTARAREDAPSLDETASRRRHPQLPGPETGTDGGPAEAEAEELEMPKALNPEWHEGVRRALAAAPADVRQPMLDELEGQLSILRKDIRNPVGYLHALIRRHASGTLDLAMAEKVAADRLARQRVAKVVAQAAQRPAAGQSSQSGAEPQAPSATAIEARQRLQAIRKQMAGKGDGQ